MVASCTLNALAISRTALPCASNSEVSQQVARGPGQPAQFPNHDRVPRTDLIQQALKVGPLPHDTGYFFAEDLGAAGLLQSFELEIQVLIPRRSPRITDLHGTLAPQYGKYPCNKATCCVILLQMEFCGKSTLLLFLQN